MISELHLLHGQAMLSGEYEQLRDIHGVYGCDGGGEQGAVVAREWFTYRKRGLLTSSVLEPLTRRCWDA